jgi:hypothetical protein
MVEFNIFGRRINIVGIYAPTNFYPEKVKDKFWETAAAATSNFTASF